MTFPRANSPFSAAPGWSATIGGEGSLTALGSECSTPGSTAHRGRSAPPSGRGRDGGEWPWGAPGARPSHGLRRGPSRGEVLLWGAQSLSLLRPTGAPRAQGAQLLPRPHVVQGFESQFPSPRPTSPLASALGPLTGPFPKPTPKGPRPV